MIINIETTDPLDSGPVNLHSIWDIMDWGRLSQRIFINMTVSGYWDVDETGLMKKVYLIGNTIPDITFFIDMRKMDINLLHSIYQKLQINKKIHYKVSSISGKKILKIQKDTHLVLSQLK